MTSAGIVGITIVVLAISVTVIVATYCFIRRPRMLRGRLRCNGGRASDLLDDCDAGAAGIPSPPPYDDGQPMPSPPPPYSPSADKPPDYEVVLLRNGQCLYRPRTDRTDHDVLDSDACPDAQQSQSSV